MEHDFCHKRKIYNFDPYNILLAIATNIPVLLMTAFVLQGHTIISVHIFIIMLLSRLADYQVCGH